MARARRLTLALVALSGVAAGAATDPVTTLAGRYSRGFDNAMVSGERYRSEDIVEIVPVDRRHAYLRMELQFFNGHSCSLVGIAQRQGDALVYAGPPDDAFVHGKPCRLTVRRTGKALTWDDAGGTCRAHCGARGSLGDGDLPWASKRPIRYLARLKGSREYREAVAAWRAR
jgi:hypothetical protein